MHLIQNKMTKLEVCFGLAILIIGSFGILINTFAIYILKSESSFLTRFAFCNRRRRSHQYKKSVIFHEILRLMSVYDIIVVVSVILIFALPLASEDYNKNVMPKITNWINPVVHMALMTSVYCTIFVSLERYIRICFLCQLKANTIHHFLTATSKDPKSSLTFLFEILSNVGNIPGGF